MNHSMFNSALTGFLGAFIMLQKLYSKGNYVIFVQFDGLGLHA